MRQRKEPNERCILCVSEAIRFPVRYWSQKNVISDNYWGPNLRTKYRLQKNVAKEYLAHARIFAQER